MAAPQFSGEFARTVRERHLNGEFPSLENFYPAAFKEKYGEILGAEENFLYTSNEKPDKEFNKLQDFADFHKLEVGDRLVFVYDRSCHFTILIYRNKATRTSEPFATTPGASSSHTAPRRASSSKISAIISGRSSLPSITGATSSAHEVPTGLRPPQDAWASSSHVPLIPSWFPSVTGATSRFPSVTGATLRFPSVTGATSRVHEVSTGLRPPQDAWASSSHIPPRPSWFPSVTGATSRVHEVPTGLRPPQDAWASSSHVPPIPSWFPSVTGATSSAHKVPTTLPPPQAAWASSSNTPPIPSRFPSITGATSWFPSVTGATSGAHEVPTGLRPPQDAWASSSHVPPIPSWFPSVTGGTSSAHKVPTTLPPPQDAWASSSNTPPIPSRFPSITGATSWFPSVTGATSSAHEVPTGLRPPQDAWASSSHVPPIPSWFPSITGATSRFPSVTGATSRVHEVPTGLRPPQDAWASSSHIPPIPSRFPTISGAISRAHKVPTTLPPPQDAWASSSNTPPIPSRLPSVSGATSRAHEVATIIPTPRTAPSPLFKNMENVARSEIQKYFKHHHRYAGPKRRLLRSIVDTRAQRKRAPVTRLGTGALYRIDYSEDATSERHVRLRDKKYNNKRSFRRDHDEKDPPEVSPYKKGCRAGFTLQQHLDLLSKTNERVVDDNALAERETIVSITILKTATDSLLLEYRLSNTDFAFATKWSQLLNDKDVLLSNQCGKKWRVTWNPATGVDHTTTGWKPFVAYNKLQAGDRCDLMVLHYTPIEFGFSCVRVPGSRVPDSQEDSRISRLRQSKPSEEKIVLDGLERAYGSDTQVVGVKNKQLSKLSHFHFDDELTDSGQIVYYGSDYSPKNTRITRYPQRPPLEKKKLELRKRVLQPKVGAREFITQDHRGNLKVHYTASSLI